MRHESVPLDINLLAVKHTLTRAIIPAALLLFLTQCFIGCDSTTSPKDIFDEGPVISNFEVSPQNVAFSPTQDGVKDTTVQVTFLLNTLNLSSEQKPSLTLTNRFTGVIELEEKMAPTSADNEFMLMIPIQTKTTFFKEYYASVVVEDDDGDYNYAQASLELKGFSVIPPTILEVQNPDSVQRPLSGGQLYPFTAKVTDQEGQDTIEGVFVRIINPETGEVSSSPFQLYDNGTEGDDVTANDSVYTITFPVDENSQLQTFDLQYYAIDKGGLVSDTVKTTFSIID